MKKIKVVISSPIDDNLYSLLMSKLCLDSSQIEIVGIFCLKVFSFTRIYNEFKRLKKKIFIKIINKYFIRKTIDKTNFIHERLISDSNLKIKSLKKFSKLNKIDFFQTNSPNDLSVLNFLKNKKPDLILSIGSIILRQNFLNTPKIGTLNVHMGILPEFRGIGVTEWPVIEAESLDQVNLGITLHFVEKGVDTGPILYKKNIPIIKNDTFSSIESRFLPEMVDAMLRGIKMIHQGKYEKVIQSNKSGKQYFFTHHRMREIFEKKLNLFLNDK